MSEGDQAGLIARCDALDATLAEPEAEEPPPSSWALALRAMASGDSDGPEVLQASLEDHRESFVALIATEGAAWLSLWAHTPDEGLQVVRIVRDWVARLPADTEGQLAAVNGMGLILNRGIPDGIPVTSQGYPIRVQIQATRTVGYCGGIVQKTFRRGTIFRGQVAWDLWDHHRSLVAPLVN